MLTHERIPESLQLPSPAEAQQRADGEVPLRQEAGTDVGEVVSAFGAEETLVPEWNELFSPLRHKGG